MEPKRAVANKTNLLSNPQKSVLLIKAPKSINGSLKKFGSFFGDLHKFIKDEKELSEAERGLSFEILLQENYLHYRVVGSPKLLPVVKSLFYTKFKELEIVVDKTFEEFGAGGTLAAEFTLKRSNYFPLRMEFSSVNDPYVIISAVLSKFKRFDEGAVFQLVLIPTSEPWLRQFLREKFYFVVGTLNSIKIFLENPFLEREYINYYEEVKKKFGHSLFLANLRLLAYGESKATLEENFHLLVKSLDKFKKGDINSFRQVKTDKETALSHFMGRQLTVPQMVLNTQEVAAVFHFPDTELEISSVYRISAKEIEPPKELPISNFLADPSISAFGISNFRSSNLSFGIKREDRDRHLYIVGKTGMGKSKLIELLAIADIHYGKGVGIIDPHGDLATNILRFVPKDRVDDVIYFNPADGDYPVGFNPLECYTPEAKHQVVTGFVAIFKKLFAHSWTNRLEHMLRFTILALVEAGEATVVDIVRLLTDVEFRQATVAKLKDPVVKNFWTHEFAAWNEKFDNEAIIPIINQVGQFIANDYIRNVVGQKKSAVDFYQAMNEGKIVVVNIAKGKLGEDNSSLMGSMIITKIQEATMARVSIPENQRREFYLYVDEFQNFATEAFNQILSEARKFNLSITLAHQYLDQLSKSIRKTAFGNVGSLICFRLGSEDAHFLSKEFAPQVTPDDLVNLDFRGMYVKLAIGGKTSAPFSAMTVTVPEPKKGLTEAIIEATRERYATPKSEVERQLWEGREAMGLLAEEKGKGKKEVEFEEPIV